MTAASTARFARMQKFCNTVFVGVPITITSRGVITLPARLRRELGLRADDQLVAEVTPEGLLLRPAVTLPLEIYTPDREREFDEAEQDLSEALKPRGRATRGSGGARRRATSRTR